MRCIAGVVFEDMPDVGVVLRGLLPTEDDTLRRLPDELLADP